MLQPPLPYDMFELARSAEQARRADKLESIYHRGQDLAWNGHKVLEALVARHGRPQLDPQTRKALQRLFSILMWGELAAWRISAQLADRLEALEPKLAATSQAHDEARHFYVLHDYLALLGESPGRPDPAAEAVLAATLLTDSLPEKLLGMQLLIENIALTIFHSVRELRVEPVLTELLAYFEKDEARHVGLGVQALPDLLRGMSLPEGIKLLAFQLRLIGNVLRSLKSLEPDFRALGIPPRAVIELGTAKMESSTKLMFAELGVRTTKGHELTVRATGAVVELAFPPDDAPSWRARIGAALRVVRHGIAQPAPTA